MFVKLFKQVSIFHSFLQYENSSSKPDDHPTIDYTPPQYITLLFTDLGVLTPSAVSDELIKLYYWPRPPTIIVHADPELILMTSHNNLYKYNSLQNYKYSKIIHNYIYTYSRFKTYKCGVHLMELCMCNGVGAKDVKICQPNPFLDLPVGVWFHWGWGPSRQANRLSAMQTRGQG